MDQCKKLTNLDANNMQRETRSRKKRDRLECKQQQRVNLGYIRINCRKTSKKLTNLKEAREMNNHTVADQRNG